MEPKEKKNPHKTLRFAAIVLLILTLLSSCAYKLQVRTELPNRYVNRSVAFVIFSQEIRFTEEDLCGSNSRVATIEKSLAASGYLLGFLFLLWVIHPEELIIGCVDEIKK